MAIYRFTDWRLAEHDTYGMVYRPSWKTLAGRLTGTALAALLIAGAFYTYGQMGGLIGGLALQVLWGLTGVLALIGILLPLSCLWNRLSISVDPYGNLVVRQMGAVLPSSRDFPLGPFKRIGVFVQEDIRASRYRRYRAGWRWVVVLLGPDAENGVQFWSYWQKHEPSDFGRIPEKVQAFVSGLSALTGLAAGEQQVVRSQGRGARRGLSVAPTVDVRSGGKIYHSLDEIPQAMRARAEEAIARARQSGPESGFSGVHTSRVITVQGADGATHTYHSLDEMPPEERRRVEGMMGERGVRANAGGLPASSAHHSITFRDREGNVHKHNSAEEMPPEVRAIYERLRRTPPPSR